MEAHKSRKMNHADSPRKSSEIAVFDPQKRTTRRHAARLASRICHGSIKQAMRQQRPSRRSNSK